MREVRLCLVGAGRAGMVHGRNFAFHLPGARVVAVVDPVEEARLRAAGELNAVPFPALPDALEAVEVDAVCVATPTDTHHALTLVAARAGKHVLCEKPMARSREEALEMLEVVRQTGVLFQMGFMRRFDPEFRQAAEVIASGALGRITLIRSTTRGPHLPPPWAREAVRSLGLLAEVCSHDFDTVRWLGGGEFAEVYARAATRKGTLAGDRAPDAYDVAVVSARLVDGALAMIDGACPVEYGYDARVEILGTEGLLMVGSVASGTVTRVTRDGAVIGSTFPSWRDRHREAYLAEDRHFLECVREGRPPAVSALDGLRALEAVLAALRSLESGHPEPVALAAVGARTAGGGKAG